MARNLFFLSGSQFEESGQKIPGTVAGSHREELLHPEVMSILVPMTESVQHADL